MSAAGEPKQDRRIWLLSLVFSFPYGGWISGALIFAAYYGLFKTFTNPDYITVYAMIFLTGMVAYMVPIYALIINRSLQAFDALVPLMNAEPAQKREWRQSIDHKSTTWTALVVCFGLAAGAAHLMIQQWDSTASITILLSDSTASMAALGTVMIWLTIITVITSLMHNASLFYRLGRDHLRLNLLNTGELVPLAWVSVISTLSIIGAQSLLGLLILDNNSGLATMIPGFVAMGLPMLPMFILPIWSIHKRLQQAKAAELSAVQKELDKLSVEQVSLLQDHHQLAQFNTLLAYRREINGVHAWPFNLGALSRLAFYLVIPPLTWVGAALIENLVETLL
jgi:hypothetical protein